jgi:hypothetical protein
VRPIASSPAVEKNYIRHDIGRHPVDILAASEPIASRFIREFPARRLRTSVRKIFCRFLAKPVVVLGSGSRFMDGQNEYHPVDILRVVRSV